MLKFLVDESSGKKLALALKGKGYDAIYAGDELYRVKDEDILEKSEKEKRILVTNDKDFGELVFRLKKPTVGIVLLRLKNDVPENRIKILLLVIDKLKSNLWKKFIVVSEDRLRIKGLQ